MSVRIDGEFEGKTEENCPRPPTHTWAMSSWNGDQRCYTLPVVGSREDMTTSSPIKSDHIKGVGFPASV